MTRLRVVTGLATLGLATRLAPLWKRPGTPEPAVRLGPAGTLATKPRDGGRS